ncbi:MAG TPA: PAS domain S-box protein [Methanospirillum sp.]|uniref:hybrid sensor histidine kinase/response regulator n=1 Tax=Methanospirillum sp. TaxID=45200 RepID=UPI002C2E9A7C|nr:PAS domain S-box protein [Methanospirillum sp.]HWQ64720.1 PAS domain S-box protein [Methanospirillum sp.]
MIQPISRILYIDDEPGFLDLCKTFLERSGELVVKTTRSGSEALRLLKEEHFDAIIADYLMPGMDGVELLIAVRSDPLISEIPFILFTARGREEVVIKAINNGADFYLQKGGETGIRFLELAETVKTTIRRRKNRFLYYQDDENLHSNPSSPEDSGDTTRKTANIHGIHQTDDSNIGFDHLNKRNKTEQRELRCSSIIAHAPWGIHCYRLENEVFIFETANQAAQRMTGIKAESLRGRPVTEVFPALVSAGITDILEEINLSGQSWHSDNPVRFSDIPDAKAFDLFVFRTSPGNISVILNEPVRGREKEIIPPRELYQSFIEASPDVIIITDITGNIIFSSPKSQKMFSLPPDTEVNGTEILAWISPDYRYQAFDSISRHLRGEQTPPAIYWLLRIDGTSFPAEIHSAPLHDKAGKITGIVSIIRDTSERTEQQDALERGNRKLNLLSSITRHDILNKITALRLYCSLIEEGEDPAQNKEMILKIEQMASNISDLVTFTSYYQNLGINTARWIAPAEVVTRIVDMIELDNIRIKNNFGMVMILADPLFEKVLYNLFDNAVKYGRKITTVKTGYEITNDGIILYVEDDGVGISHEEKEKIFDRNVGSGTGLGLFLSREILSVTNLSIRETGTAGVGARFEILVPPSKYQIPL